jgi:hypothetical protein
MDQMDRGAGYGRSSTASVSYPRDYRYSRGVQFFLYVFAAIMGAAGTWMASIQIQQAASVVLLLSGLAMVLLAVYIAMSCAMSRLVLRADSIEMRGPLGSRMLRRDAIAGRRRQPTRGKPILIVVPKSGRPLRLDSGFKSDSVLNAWIDALPDLDLQERQASEAKLIADPAFGSSPKDRLDRLAKARQVAKVANGVTVAAVLWAYVYPHPYQLAILLLALLPWCAVAIVALSRGLICFDTLRNDVRPHVALMLIMPALVLGMRGLLDINVVDVTRTLEFGFIAGLPLVFVVSLVGQRNQQRPWALPLLMLLVVALPYGGGLVAVADVMFDHQASQVFQTQVLRKYIASGKHPQPYLVLAPWGPEVTGGRIAVSRAYYMHAQVNTAVCVNLHRGAVGLRWYGVHDCTSVPNGDPARLP